MRPLNLAALVLGLQYVTCLKVRGPQGPGIPEETKDLACKECKRHAEYLDRKQDCSCHATDIMGTFENDATKELTTRKEYGFETANTGKTRLSAKSPRSLILR